MTSLTDGYARKKNELDNYCSKCATYMSNNRFVCATCPIEIERQNIVTQEQKAMMKSVPISQM